MMGGEQDSTKAVASWDELIFEVGCLGCGKTAFNLPYRKNTHHTMTCQKCGEVTIAHVGSTGNIATATAAQRDIAVGALMHELDEYLRTWKLVAWTSNRDSYVRPSWTHDVEWKQTGRMWFADTRAEHASRQTEIQVVTDGLRARVKMTDSAVKGIQTGYKPKPDFSRFNGRVLVHIEKDRERK